MSVGQQVTLITVDDKTFNGVLNTFDDRVGKVVLKNVVTDGCELPDLQTFFVSDIKDLAFLDGHGTREDSSESLLDYVKRKPGRFLSKRTVPPHLLRNPTFNGDKMLLSRIAGDEDGIDQGIGSGEDGDNFEDFYETDDYLLFCRPCEKFREAVCYLMEQDIVAAMFYGVEIGRKGTLSVLEVATEEYIFLFDMLRLGMEGFIDGLQELLESKDVVKIIHDCRMVSDMLYHQYNLTLSNVFDTQVAGAFVFRNLHGGDWPRSVESLPSALLLHLHLTEDDVHIAYVRERSRKMDEEVWLHRPLSKPLLASTLKNLKRLIPLYHHMCQKLMLPFKVGVDIYLDHVRSAPEGTAAKQRVNSHLLPFAFQDLEKITASSIKESSHAYQKQRDPTYDHRGFCENTIRHGLHHAKVIKSRDSIWHSSLKGFPSSKSKPKNSESKMSDGLPPEEWYSYNRKSKPPAIKERLASNERPVESIKSSSKDKKKGSVDTPPFNVSNSKLQDSAAADEKLRDLSGSFCDPPHSPVVLPKSSTPNNSSQSVLPSSSSDISRSALFELDESPLPALDISESEERSSLKYNDRVAESPSTAHISPEVSNSRLVDDCRSSSHHDRKNRVLSLSPCKRSYKPSSDNEGNNFSIDRQRGSAESSFADSKEESNMNTFDEGKMKISYDRSFEEVNMIPAGVQIRKIGKKRAKRIQEQIQMDSRHRDGSVSHVSSGKNKLLQNDLEEELSSIPRPYSVGTLKSQTSTSLNSSVCSVGVGDPCDVGTSVKCPPSSKSILSSISLPQCQPVNVPLSSSEDEDAGEQVKESYIDAILKLEEVQKILRQTKLDKPSTDIKRKLLSSKIRL